MALAGGAAVAGSFGIVVKAGKMITDSFNQQKRRDEYEIKEESAHKRRLILDDQVLEPNIAMAIDAPYGPAPGPGAYGLVIPYHSFRNRRGTRMFRRRRFRRFAYRRRGYGRSRYLRLRRRRY